MKLEKRLIRERKLYDYQITLVSVINTILVQL